MRVPTISAAILAVVLGSSCAETDGYYAGSFYAGAYTPDLVTVGPGVSVIADWNEPIFYSNNYYWRNYNNRWWRSPYYNRGWSYATPPRSVSRIDRPWAYRHYRPYGYVTRPYGDRSYRQYRDRNYYQQRDRYHRDRTYYRDRSTVRDHRYRS